jgi:hypothetical protein
MEQDFSGLDRTCSRNKVIDAAIKDMQPGRHGLLTQKDRIPAERRRMYRDGSEIASTN